MRRIVLIVFALSALAGCRGEPVPRDYQNAPPAMTHPVDNKDQSPAQHGMPAASPEPNSGAEGKAAPDKPVVPVPPTTTSTTGTSGTTGTTATSGTTVTTST